MEYTRMGRTQQQEMTARALVAMVINLKRKQRG